MAHRLLPLEFTLLPSIHLNKGIEARHLLLDRIHLRDSVLLNDLIPAPFPNTKPASLDLHGHLLPELHILIAGLDPISRLQRVNVDVSIRGRTGRQCKPFLARSGLEKIADLAGVVGPVGVVEDVDEVFAAVQGREVCCDGDGFRVVVLNLELDVPFHAFQLEEVTLRFADRALYSAICSAEGSNADRISLLTSSGS